LIHWIIMPAEKLAAYSIAARHPLVPRVARRYRCWLASFDAAPQPRDGSLGSPLREDFSPNGLLSGDDAGMWGEQRDAGRLSLAANIFHCEVVAATLRGHHTPCRDVVAWQGLQPDVPRYVPEPWAGHLGSAPILFVSSNPSAGEQGEPFDPRLQWGSDRSSEELFMGAEGAFDPGPWPGITEGIYNRDRTGRRVGGWVRFWGWTRRIAGELLDREPTPGWDYALTEVVHCGSQQEHGVSSALQACTSRYLRGVLHASAARVIVLTGRTALRAFQAEIGLHLNDGLWGPGELAGMTRCVIWLPHPNARGPKKGLVENLGPRRADVARSQLRTGDPAPHANTHATMPGPVQHNPSGEIGALAHHRGNSRHGPLGRVDRPPRGSQMGSQGAPSMTAPAPHFRVMPRRQNAYPDEIAAPRYVVVSRQSPWEPGAYRLVIPVGQDPCWRIGQLVDLFHAKRDDWLGKYEVIGNHPGRIYIWDLQ
jgi:hypothetical protein